MKDNKLIAEFMGFQKTDIGWYDFQDSLPEYVHILNGGNTFDTLLFEISWDWLIPVVEKIDDMGVDVIIRRDSCQIIGEDREGWEYDNISDFGGGRRITVFTAVLDFIEQYNQNKNER